MFKTQEVAGGDFLRKFLLEIKRFPSMQSLMVWRMLFFEQQVEFPISLRTDKQEKGHKRKRGSGESVTSAGVEEEGKGIKGLSRGKRRRCINDAV